MSVFLLPIFQNASAGFDRLRLFALSAALGDESRRTGAVVGYKCASRRTTPEASHCSVQPLQKASHTPPTVHWMDDVILILLIHQRGINLSPAKYRPAFSLMFHDSVSVCIRLFPLSPNIALLSVRPSLFLPQLPSTLQAVATCALQSALSRPYSLLPSGLPVSPVASPCAFRSFCLIHELPVAPVMSHLGHRKPRCK